MEPLEARQLLSAAVGPIWTINGTDGPDNIVVSYNASTRAFDYFLNNTLIKSRPAAGLNRIVINGGAGDDVITVSGTRAIPTTINGGDGNDTLTGGVGYNLIYGGAGDDTIYGGPSDDIIHGGAGNDTIDGGGGRDIIYGDAGDDFIQGGAGNDRIYGESGNDTLLGGTGYDSLNGGAGSDVDYCVKGIDANVPDQHDSVINRQDIPVIHLSYPTGYQAGSGASSTITVGTGSTAAMTLVLQTSSGATVPVSGVLTLSSGAFQLSDTTNSTTVVGTLDTIGLHDVLTSGSRLISLTDAGNGNYVVSNANAAQLAQNTLYLPTSYVSPLLGNGTLAITNSTGSTTITIGTGGTTLPPVIVNNPQPITLQTTFGTAYFSGPLTAWPVNSTTIKITLTGTALQGATWALDAGNLLDFTAAAGAQASVTLTDDQIAQFNQLGGSSITSLAITNPIIVGTTLQGNGQILFAAPAGS